MNAGNSTANFSGHPVSGKTGIEILELVCLSQVDVLTLFGNALVILAFVFGPRSIRTYTNYFVVNLSVSDLMVGCISIPSWIVFRTDENLISSTVFDFLMSLDVLCGITSIFSLAAISLERMVAVKFPQAHMDLKKTHVVIAIVATWVIGIVMSASFFGDDDDHHTYTASIFTFGFLIPLAVIIGSYCAIFYAAINMMKSANENVSVTRELRVAKTVSVIISLFVICWSPFFIVNMVYHFCASCPRLLSLIYVSKIMHYSNSMMNFFVYGARSPDFRNFFRKILCPRSRKNSEGNRRSRVELTSTSFCVSSEADKFMPDCREAYGNRDSLRSSQHLEASTFGCRVSERF